MTADLRARLAALVGEMHRRYALRTAHETNWAEKVEALLREPPEAQPDADAKLRALRSFCRDCRRVDADDFRTPAIAECIRCGELDCPHNEPLHYHHDGCPACHGTLNAARAAAPAKESA